MEAILLKVLTISIMFSGGVQPSDIEVIRSVVGDQQVEVLFVEGDVRQPANLSAEDWGLSALPQAGGIELQFRDIEQEDARKLSEDVTEKLKPLLKARGGSIDAKFSEGDKMVTARRLEVLGPTERPGGPGSASAVYPGMPPATRTRGPAAAYGGAYMPYGSRSYPPGSPYGALARSRISVATDQMMRARRPSAVSDYVYMTGVPGMFPVDVADMELSAEETEQWMDLDQRATALAAEYQGEGERLVRLSSDPSIAGPAEVQVRMRDKGKIEEELTQILNEMFDLKLVGYERKITNLEQELKSLRQRLEERRANKELIVKRRLNELTGVEDHLAW